MRKYLPITIRRPVWSLLKMMEDLELVKLPRDRRSCGRTNLPPTVCCWDSSKVNDLIHARFDPLVNWETADKRQVEAVAQRAIGMANQN